MSQRKSPEERVNRIPPVYPDKLLPPWDGKVRGIELPEMDSVVWCVRTREWWQMIRETPQAALFKLSDWHNLLDTALLHNEMWSNPSLKATERSTIAGEIRRRTEAYGFTWRDRQKFGIAYADPEDVVEEAESALRQSSVDYRAALQEKSR